MIYIAKIKSRSSIVCQDHIEVDQGMIYIAKIRKRSSIIYQDQIEVDHGYDIHSRSDRGEASYIKIKSRSTKVYDIHSRDLRSNRGQALYAKIKSRSIVATINISERSDRGLSRSSFPEAKAQQLHAAEFVAYTCKLKDSEAEKKSPMFSRLVIHVNRGLLSTSCFQKKEEKKQSFVFYKIM
jgi:hypothetical protein